MPRVFIYESTVGFIRLLNMKLLKRSFDQSVSVRDSLSLFKLSPLNERSKRFFPLLCGKRHHKKEHRSENDPINR